MVLDEIMTEQVNTMSKDAVLPQLALMPLGNDYSNIGFGGSGRQEEGLPSDLLTVLLFDDEDSEEEEDMEEESFDDDMDEDFDDDFDDDEDDFDDEDYDDDDEDYDYEEDVDYDDFDE